MGTLSVGRLWLHRSPHLLLVILIGILIATPTLGQLQRNTASRNIWRRQPADGPAPAYLQRNPASRNVFLPQSRPAEDPAASQSEPNPASGTLSRRESPLPVESADDAAGDQLQPNTASRTVFRRQSPPDDDAAAAAPPPNAPPPPALPNAKPSQNQINGGGYANARAGGTAGFCHHCTRIKGTLECLDKDPPPPPPGPPTVGPFIRQCDSDAGDKDNVRCITFLMEMKGTREKSDSKIKDDEKKMRRIDGRTCMHQEYIPAIGSYEPRSASDCALENLNLKLEDKCIKGTYEVDRLSAFVNCAGWGIAGLIHRDMKDKESLPKPGTPEYKDVAKHGIFYGEYGRTEYAVLTICACKGELCNHKTKLGSPAEASAAARNLRMGILRLLPA